VKGLPNGQFLKPGGRVAVSDIALRRRFSAFLSFSCFVSYPSLVSFGGSRSGGVTARMVENDSGHIRPPTLNKIARLGLIRRMGIPIVT